MSEILTGLSVKDYAHPDDIAAINALKTFAEIDNIMTKLGDKANNLVNRAFALGYCVRITQENSPKLYNLVSEVCEILDYKKMPEIYTKRGYSLDVDVSGADNPTIIIPNNLIDSYNDLFLRFAVGRAISKLKSDYLKFYTIAKATIEIVEFSKKLPDAINILFARWMQKAELTADRGGLLACQDFNTSMRFLMNYAGMPVAFTETVSVPDYIELCRTDDKAVKTSKAMLTLTNCTGWYNDRIVELFNWYSLGEYSDILDSYKSF